MDASKRKNPQQRTRFLWLSWVLTAAWLGGCAHSSRGAPKELWIPAQTDTEIPLEGRELWIDVELSGYTRQNLERFSDYEAQHDDPPIP